MHISTGKSKRILENVTGCFQSGKLTAIIGPSGAGKTTLLRIISTLKSSNVEGTVTVNGRECNGSIFRKHTSFLPQEFALLPLLTTRETLYIAARLKVQGVREPRAFHLIVSLFKHKQAQVYLFKMPAAGRRQSLVQTVSNN